MEHLQIRPMPYYADRGNKLNCIEISNNLLQNHILLWGSTYFEPSTENIFDTVFKTSVVLNRAYLFAMDYLSILLSAYEQTKSKKYQDKFFEIIHQFFDYYERGSLILSKEDDLIPSAQTLMFIKSFSLIKYEEPLKDKVIQLLYTYAQYCRDDQNHFDSNNHGLFTDIALLHLSVLFSALPEAEEWQNHAIDRVQRLFEVAFYEDGFNNEGSLTYFRHNLIQYGHIVDFCDKYNLPGLKKVRDQLKRSKNVFQTFAHSDGSYPMIGDSADYFSLDGINNKSALYPDAGICVVKTGEMYLTFKCKTTFQAHAQTDVSSITARFRSLDLALDPGQYNYDRYHPINRYLRTSGGHSGIFPLSVDGLTPGEYLARQTASGISRFDPDGSTYFLSGGYELDDGAIKVQRDIMVMPDRIEVRDSWSCAVPQSMRQRFVLPKEFLEFSRFTASKNLFETTVEDVTVRYEVTSKDTPIVTSMNFGVQSKKLMEYEPTLLLDTIAESSLGGSIQTVITMFEKAV